MGAQSGIIEVLSEFFDETDVDDAFFLDSGVTYDSTATTSVTGLDHLEGETVTILADGKLYQDLYTVSSGAVTIPTAASTIQTGLSYTSTMSTMKIEAGMRDGVSQGRWKKINNCVLRLYKTLGLKIGSGTDNVEEIVFQTLGGDVELFSGDKVIDSVPASLNRNGYIVLVQDKPLPFTLLSIMPHVNTSNIG